MKHVRTIGLLALTAAILLGVTGCGWFAEEVVKALTAPDGYVYDVTTGDPIGGATVKLSASDGTSESTTSESDGYYKFEDVVDYDVYELTASKSGYAFTKLRVEVSGVAQRFPNIGGYVPGTEAFRIVAFWNDEFADVDAYLTMPNGDKGIGAIDPIDFYRLDSGVVSSGFFPSDIERQKLYWGTPNRQILDGTTVVAELDVDNQGKTTQPEGGPETVSVYWFPFVTSYDGTAATYAPAAEDKSGLETSLTYNWVGTMEYWLDAWAETNTSSTSPASESDSALLASEDFFTKTADPVVYVFDSAGNQLAALTLPHQQMATASVLRINMFMGSDDGEYYQFLPNVRAFKDDTSVKSLSPSTVWPFVIKGGTRK